MSVLEVGVAAAVTAGLVNWFRMRRLIAAGVVFPAAGNRGADAAGADPQGAGPGPGTGDGAAGEGGHHIYVDPWADAEDGADSRLEPPGPASLP